MSIRKITFPDHTADDFDENQVFEADNGLKYIWNGRYGWELVDGGIEDYDDQWIKDDQQRQDDALADYKKEVELGQQRQDDKLDDFKREVDVDQERQDKELADYKQQVAIDQQRQDDELEALRNEIFPEGGDACDTPGLSATFVYGTYGNGQPDGICYFTTSGTTTHLEVPQNVHGDTWPNPTSEPPDSLWINGEEYGVTGAGNKSGYHWYYDLDKDVPLSLQNQTVSLSLCEPDNGSSSSVFVKKEGDTMSGDLKVNANVIADKVVSRIIDSGENSNLELKHDGNTKVYVGKTQLTSQEQLKLNKEGTETYHAVTKGYIDTDQKRQDDALQEEIQARAERDALHDAQINTIEYKLDALVGLQFKGIYEFKHENDCNLEYERCIDNCMAIDPQDHECRQMCGRNQMDCERDKVRPGYFEAVDPDDRFDHLEYIVISKADKAGVEVDWAGVLDEGDYLEVDHTADGVLDKTNYGLYRITEEPEHGSNAYGEDVYTIRVQFLQGDGVMNVRENYEIRGITAAEGVNPEELGDFLTKDEAAATYAIKQHGHSWSEVSGKPSSYPPSSHTHSNYVKTDTGSEQTLVGALRGTYFYGTSSSRDDGMLNRKTIETMISNAGGGGSDGSDHNHDSRYPRMSTGSSSNPSPSTGDFYLDTSRKVLYIGV